MLLPTTAICGEEHHLTTQRTAVEQTSNLFTWRYSQLCCHYKLMLWFDAPGYCWNNQVFWMIFILGQSMHEQNGTRGILSIFYSNHKEAQYPIFSPLYKWEENRSQNVSLNLRSLMGIGTLVCYWSVFFSCLLWQSQKSLQMITLPSSFLISKVTNDTAFQVYQYFFLVKQGVSFKGLYNVLSTQPVLNKVRNIAFAIMKIKQTHYLFFNCGRISSIIRALDCRAGGCRFNSWGCTSTHGLKITEKWRISSPLHCKWLDLCVARMAM